MATALINSPASIVSDASSQAAPTRSTSPMLVAVATTAACIAIVWVATVVALLLLTSTSFWGAVGVGGYASFWLGGGFGVIFGSAAVFGKDH